MPQFNFHDWAPQLVWLAITFIGLYLVMARMALPRIANVIEERRDRIQRDLDEAERLKEETEAAIASYERALAEARGKAHGIAQETRDKLAVEIAADQVVVDNQIAASIAAAEKKITTAKNAALEHINEVATDTASALIEKIIGQAPNASDVKKAVNSLG